VIDAQEPGEMIELVSRLRDALDTAGVVYCHWKSNEALRQAASGDQDLDLLIAREDATRFASIVQGLGFVLARPSRDRQLPGILDYYGVDQGTMKIVHVHAHYQLVVGDDMTKNFRLPVEQPYLRSRTNETQLPIPSADWEYLVFVIRMVVKHSPLDAQIARKGKLSLSERRELVDLTARSEPEQVDDLRRSHLPIVGDDLFQQCLDAIHGRLNRIQRALVARRLLRALDGLGRHRPGVDASLRVWRRLLRRYRARSERQPIGKRPDVGGAVVAIVGGDGSGKSTAVSTLVDHFAKDMAVRRIHMGKPPWSRWSRLVRRPIQKARRRGLFEATRLTPWDSIESFPGLSFCVWHASIARDRFLQYRRARRDAGRGVLVVSDRWPLSNIGLMDSARLGRIPGLTDGRVANWLAARERRYYDSILPPDLVIVLRASPGVAIERRHEDSAEFVRIRASEVFDSDWSGLPAVVIDADLPEVEVQRRVRQAVWSIL